MSKDDSGARKSLFGLISALLGIVIAVVIVELGLGVFKPNIDPAGQMDEGFIIYDSRLGWKLAPGWQGNHRHYDFSVKYDINRLGFRGDQRDFAQPGSVVFLGDSFTFGLGVSNQSVFTELLNTSDDRRKALNAGVPGYSNDQQLLLINKLAGYRPDALVWVVYLGNDLLDNGEPYPLQAAHGKPYFRLGAGDGLVLENVPVPLRPKPAEYLSRSVQSEILGDYQPYSVWQSWIEEYETGRLVNGLIGIDAKGLSQHIKNQSGAKVDLFMAIIKAGRAELVRSGIDLQIVLLPGRSYVQADSIPGVYQATMASILQDRLNDNNINVLNLAQAIEKVDDAGKLFHPNEGHFNAAGHKWLAEELADSTIW